MGRRRIIATVLLLFVWLPASVASGQQERSVRFGVLAGIAGQLPIGDDVSQPGASGDEYVPAMAIEIEFLTFDIGRVVQIVPYFRRTVVGGIDEDVYAAALGDAADVTGSHMSQVGIGGRWFFVQLERLRPFVGLYLAHVSTEVSYEVDISDQLPPGLEGLIGPVADAWRNTGMGLTVGAGLRWDFDVAFWGQEWLLPLVVEAQWTKNVWLGSEHDVDLVARDANLAPEGMNLDLLSVHVSFGLMY